MNYAEMLEHAASLVDVRAWDAETGAARAGDALCSVVREPAHVDIGPDVERVSADLLAARARAARLDMVCDRLREQARRWRVEVRRVPTAPVPRWECRPGRVAR